MAKEINGRNIVLYKYDSVSNTDIPFACSTSCGLSIQNDLKETTSQTSAFFKEYKQNLTTWSISVSGFTILNTEYNYLLILNLIAERASFLVKFVIDNGTIEGLTIFSGQVIISSFELSGTDDALSTYTVSLQGTGAYLLRGTIVTPGGIIIVAGTAIQVFQAVATDGQTTFSFPTAVGLTMVYGSRGSMGIQPLAYSLQPTYANGGLWNTVKGELTLTNAAVAGEPILILAQLVALTNVNVGEKTIWVLATDSNVISEANLVGKQVQIVLVGGIGSGKIITTGTPTGNQLKFDSIAGTLERSYNFADGEEITIKYI